MRLAKRRILVTGAGSGIGRATAELFRREGADVALLDINQAAVEATASELGAGSGGTVAIVTDISKEDSVSAGVEKAESALGGLDGIINAAGADFVRPFDQMTASEWTAVLTVDLTGPMLVCSAALPALKRAGCGTIVNISSGAGLLPLARRTAYCAAKAGLNMFSKALSIDLAPYHIRVNVICPGIIDTPMFRATYEAAPDPQAELERILDRYVIRHPGSPTDVANAALYLTSNESGFVTGTTLAVDGGRTFH